MFFPHFPSATPSGPVRARRSRLPSTVAALAALLVMLAACSDGSTADEDADAGGDEVASLSEESDETATDADGTDPADADEASDDQDDTAGATSTTIKPEDAALEFSECMRNSGVTDFPDLGIDANGNIDLRDIIDNVDVDDADVQEAINECQIHLASGGFGERLRQTIESGDLEAALLEFSDCMRAEGHDVGDLTLPDMAAAAFAPVEDDADGNPQGGDREEGFGESDRILAIALGLDPEDPEVNASIDKCQPLLESAFAEIGLSDS